MIYIHLNKMNLDMKCVQRRHKQLHVSETGVTIMTFRRGRVKQLTVFRAVLFA